MFKEMEKDLVGFQTGQWAERGNDFRRETGLRLTRTGLIQMNLDHRAMSGLAAKLHLSAGIETDHQRFLTFPRQQDDFSPSMCLISSRCGSVR